MVVELVIIAVGVFAVLGIVFVCFIILSFLGQQPADISLDLSAVTATGGFERAFTHAKKNDKGAYDVFVRVIPAYWQLKVINDLPKTQTAIHTPIGGTISIKEVLEGCTRTYETLDTARIAMEHNKTALIEFGMYLATWLPPPPSVPSKVIDVEAEWINEQLR